MTGGPVKPTRREVLRLLAAAPLGVASGCACSRGYPTAQIGEGRSTRIAAGILEPQRLKGRRAAAPSVIDVHAHFFNASDVPVRGFIAESIGHNADPGLQFLIREMAALADRIAERAPTAAEELRELEALSQPAAAGFFPIDRQRATQQVVEIVRGTGFERRYREIVPAPRGRTTDRGITERDVEDAELDAGRALDPQARLDVSDLVRRAKAFLQFLRLMVSTRASNIRTYADAFSPLDGSGVDMVLGALVDFDYWLDCPPHSAHKDQVALHLELAKLHGRYFRPVIGYNPWTDIEQDGAARQRVIDAWNTGVFVAAKIYPPTGFMPAGNAGSAASTRKRRPDLTKLDGTLKVFFKECAERGIPVIGHAARSNGRDAAHDDFSSPTAWDALLCEIVKETKTPVLSLGHFGGDNPDTRWTAEFANLMKVYPNLQIFGDLGYWDRLMCEDSSTCIGARNRLKEVLSIPVGASETVADRVMFATDWLMLSQVPGWKTYAQRIREGLESIAGAEEVARIMGGNALKCFARLNA
jgi:predicted TIM-barrel fold metal-dependent hydrolase